MSPVLLVSVSRSVVELLWSLVVNRTYCGLELFDASLAKETLGIWLVLAHVDKVGGAGALERGGFAVLQVGSVAVFSRVGLICQVESGDFPRICDLYRTVHVV
jgi:hypothetical protein